MTGNAQKGHAMKAEHGTVVSLLYTLRDADGLVLDSTEGRDALEYLHGYRNIVPGLEEALEGAEVGFRGDVRVEPEKGYGPVDPSAVFAVSRDRFPEEMDLEAGMTIVGETQDGPIKLTVREVREDVAVLDGNHPLAGVTMHFDVAVESIRESTEQERTQGYPMPRVM